MFLTETWLDQDNSAAVHIESSPPNFSFISETRMHKKGGGVSILFNELLKCKQMFYGSFTSFEYVALQVNSSSQAIFLKLYRPPKYCTYFFDDFFEDRWTKELCCVLDNFGLTQHVTQPTHNRGHILDLVISKGLNISKVLVSDIALSDPYCVFF